VNQIKEDRNKYGHAIVQWDAAVNEFATANPCHPIEEAKKRLDKLQTTFTAMASAYDELMATIKASK